VTQEFVKPTPTNPIEFIESNVTANGTLNGTPIALRDYQKSMIQMLGSEKRNYFIKARRMGFTTTAIAYIYHQMMAKQNQNVLYVGATTWIGDAARYSLDRMVKDKNKDFHGAIEIHNRATNSVCTFTTPSHVRRLCSGLLSSKYNLIVVDEAHSISNYADFVMTHFSNLDAAILVMSSVSYPQDALDRLANDIRCFRSPEWNKQVFPSYLLEAPSDDFVAPWRDSMEGSEASALLDCEPYLSSPQWLG